PGDTPYLSPPPAVGTSSPSRPLPLPAGLRVGQDEGTQPVGAASPELFCYIHRHLRGTFSTSVPKPHKAVRAMAAATPCGCRNLVTPATAAEKTPHPTGEQRRRRRCPRTEFKDEERGRGGRHRRAPAG
ncbi:unnamed protein product, partial [Ectocarpus sp. 8 AP-2014]